MRNCFQRFRYVVVLSFAMLAGAVLPVALLPAAAQAAVLRVGVYNLKPDIVALPHGKMGGIFGDLLNEIAQREGWTIQPVVCDWDDCLHKLENGTIDLLPDVIYTPERARRIDFGHVPALQSWTQIYAPKKALLHALNDLDGLTVAVLAGSAQYDYLVRALPRLGIATYLLPVKELKKGFEFVREGRADAVVSDYLFGELTAPRFNLVAMPINFMSTRIFYAAPKYRNAAILADIDRYLKVWQADPNSVYYQIMSKWLTPKMWPSQPWYHNWKVLALVLFMAVALLIALHVGRRQYLQNKRLRVSEERLNAILRSVDAMIYIKDRDQRYLYANSRVSEFFGIDAKDVLMRSNRDLITDVGAFKNTEQTDLQVLETGQQVTVQERLVSSVTGKTHTFLAVKVPLHTADGPVEGVCAILTDITERVQAEEQAYRMAFYDSLTNLPNRSLWIARLEQALQAAKNDDSLGAVLLLDLDGFKKINDTRGRQVGDVVLQEVARRLVATLRKWDTTCRMSGDDYMVLLTGLGASEEVSEQRALRVCDKLRLALAQEPLLVDGKPVLLSISIGLTLVRGRSMLVDDVIREADVAIMQAKERGGDQTVLYGRDSQVEIEQRLDLEQDLVQALNTPQLQMYLQPQYSGGGKVTGAELLMRWTHPVRGPVPPSVFIPIAEEVSLINHLTDWSLHEACLALLELQKLGKAYPLSVNLSPKRLLDPGFCQLVRETLETTGARGDRLIFEVTESLWIQDLHATTQSMDELRQLGIRFSMDDFGTGYSNLAYLKRLPLYELKIDKSLIQGIPADPDSLVIVQLILAMARRFDIKVVAEGVETKAQADILLKSNMVSLQGYLLAHPMPVSKWLDKVRRESA